MIILDTNQLEQCRPPDGPLLAMLRAVAKQSGHELCLPEIALEEHLAHYQHAVRAAQDKLDGAIEVLCTVAPPQVLEYDRKTVIYADESDARDYRRELLADVFDRIIPTPEAAFKEGMLREIRREPPASKSWERSGSGARDVAIWLTAVEACRDSEADTYFVSMDKDAFGRDELAYELQWELKNALGDHASLFHYCCGIDPLLTSLAQRCTTEISPTTIANSEAVREAVIASLGLRELENLDRLELGGFNDTSHGRKALSYRVDDSTWCCASVWWRAGFSYLEVGLNAGAWRRSNTGILRTTLAMQVNGDSIVSAEVCGAPWYNEGED